MPKQHVMVTGAKQTFLIRVAVKKIQDAGFECVFVPWNIDDINKNWDGTALVVLYMDEGESPHEDVLHFLVDKMSEEYSVMIPIGEKEDVAEICNSIPKELVYQKFIRPVNNEAFVKTVSELMNKMESGEFKKRILVVDDDPTYLGVIRDWLKEPYKVAMASSGLQAIKWLGKNKVDLILLDHEMPITGGPQVLEMLRSDPETSSIPVMFLTGKSDKESVMEVVALKPEGYFLKTIEKDELLQNLNEFFMKRKG
ncbi:MAG: response regulator [Lachnospiraceae bacterium]|nr:response regulator [Lachnospiraceae bacterium]